jgi:hypothetical protein
MRFMALIYVHSKIVTVPDFLSGTLFVQNPYSIPPGQQRGRFFSAGKPTQFGLVTPTLLMCKMNSDHIVLIVVIMWFSVIMDFKRTMSFTWILIKVYCNFSVKKCYKIMIEFTKHSIYHKIFDCFTFIISTSVVCALHNSSIIRPIMKCPQSIPCNKWVLVFEFITQKKWS